MTMTGTATRPNTILLVAVIAVLAVALATLLTVMFGGPGAGTSFDLTTDPASGLWTW
jgi:hypothetical protein